jgi:hypothetical protein
MHLINLGTNWTSKFSFFFCCFFSYFIYKGCIENDKSNMKKNNLNFVCYKNISNQPCLNYSFFIISIIISLSHFLNQIDKKNGIKQ